MSIKGTDHHSALPRIKKIAGQVNGVLKMIEDERYCVDILTQFKAIRSAIKSVEAKILEEHLNHCVHQAVKSGNSKQGKQMVDELITLVKKSTS
jgi:DNA-binding FrmR family transcriptional regulator